MRLQLERRTIRNALITVIKHLLTSLAGERNAARRVPYVNASYTHDSVEIIF
jgi:hypothetical protein